MIGKNVGIRRARGQFVLATNVDILFSDELAEYLASRRLERGRMYRSDRYDAMSDVPADARGHRARTREKPSACREGLGEDKSQSRRGYQGIQQRPEDFSDVLR
jgi:hypothetical protein